ncbi:MAG: chemotaxis protein CheC [Armatimonadota bacterium]
MHTTLSSHESTLLNRLAYQGLRRAAEALGAFSGEMLTVSDARAVVQPFQEIPYLHGNPEEVLVGVHFCITGDINGYLLAIFRELDVQILVETLCGTRPSSLYDLDELSLSALGEAGNILVSSFISEFEPLCGLNSMPSPPAVAVEMSCAIIASAIMPVLEDDGNILMVEAAIHAVEADAADAATCSVLFLPTAESWARLRQAISEQES